MVFAVGVMWKSSVRCEKYHARRLHICELLLLSCDTRFAPLVLLLQAMFCGSGEHLLPLLTFRLVTMDPDLSLSDGSGPINC